MASTNHGPGAGAAGAIGAATATGPFPGVNIVGLISAGGMGTGGAKRAAATRFGLG